MIEHNVQQLPDRLVPFKKQINNALKEIIDVVPKLIDLPDLKIIFKDEPQNTIPEIGVGGLESDVNLIEVFIDPDYKDIEKDLGDKIKSTLAHEMNHSSRENKFGYPKTLLDFFVLEGLADNFDLEVNGGEIKPWSNNLTKEQYNKVISKAEFEFYKKDYDHKSWFFGNQELKIPRWAGYSIGFKIVADYLEKTGKRASEVTLLDSSEFVID